MELVADALNDLLHGPAIHFTFLDFAGTPINNFVPLCFRISVHDVIKAGDKLMGEKCPVLFRQGHYFGHLFSGNAHIAKVAGSQGSGKVLYIVGWI